MTDALCTLCGEPMPEGETMFKYHGYSGPCPKPPLPSKPPTARKEIIRLMREDFDPTPPNWEGRDWDDNAEDVADKIIAAALSEKPTHVSDAWRIVKQWLASYAEEEATFSRYADDVSLDGVMTARERRAISAVVGEETPRGELPSGIK